MIIHVYFGDSKRHPIINNYIRSGFGDLCIDAPPIIGKSRFFARFSRAFSLIRRICSIRTEVKAPIFHTHDLISVLLVLLLMPRKKVIFDSHEVYRSYFRSWFAFYSIYLLEEAAHFFSDLTIYPSDERRCLYRQCPNDVVIENKFLVEHYAQNFNGNLNATYLYAGELTDKRCISELVAIFRRLPSKSLHIYGKLNEQFDESYFLNVPANIVYGGCITHSEMVERIGDFTAAFALYNKIDLNNTFPAPTKIFENEYFKVPTICFSSPYVDRLISDGTLRRVVTLEHLTLREVETAMGIIEGMDNNIDPSPNITWQSQLRDIENMYIGLRKKQ